MIKNFKEFLNEDIAGSASNPMSHPAADKMHHALMNKGFVHTDTSYTQTNIRRNKSITKHTYKSKRTGGKIEIHVSGHHFVPKEDKKDPQKHLEKRS